MILDLNTNKSPFRCLFMDRFSLPFYGSVLVMLSLVFYGFYVTGLGLISVWVGLCVWIGFDFCVVLRWIRDWFCTLWICGFDCVLMTYGMWFWKLEIGVFGMVCCMFLSRFGCYDFHVLFGCAGLDKIVFLFVGFVMKLCVKLFWFLFSLYSHKVNSEKEMTWGLSKRVLGFGNKFWSCHSATKGSAEKRKKEKKN